VVLRFGPYEFFFWSNEGLEPAHIHVERDDDEAKFWLGSRVACGKSRFRPRELRRIQRLVEENEIFLKEHWDTYVSG
jgi:hypothetical protein